MNEQELESILKKLGDQAEQIKKKQDVRRKIEKIDGWISALREKAAEVQKLGGLPVVDIGPKIVALEAERNELLALVTPPSREAIEALVVGKPLNTPPVAPEPSVLPPPLPAVASTWKEPMSEQDTKEMKGLLQVMDTIDMSDWSHEERWNQYEVWACMWRILVNRYPKDVVYRSITLTQVFGKIRDLMKADGPLLWYIQALDRNAEIDWQAKLQERQKQIDALAIARRSQDVEQETAQEKAIWTLMSLVRQLAEAPDSELQEIQRKLKHQVREAAKYKHLREEVAELVAPLRAGLEQEFAFLWPKEEVTETVPTRSLSTKDLLSRLMRRMKSKTLIGACHGPFEQIYKGVPEQDKGRAKELLEFLGKLGILRFKDSVIGTRISIEPKKMPVADHLINYEATGIPAIDSILGGEVRV